MRLYVGNISFKATEDDLRELFSQAGEVLNVKLI
jgi:RNA recognition motif-containing protein